MAEDKRTKTNVEKIIYDPPALCQSVSKNQIRVAAYCRVSTDMEEQQTSFEGQVRAYTEMINSRPNWILAGIYADEGITGTSADKRPEFLRMIADCEAGKIDFIITKSISRFARNTLECLTYVRHLQNIGINILFENNNIDTGTAFSEMILTVLAAFAQEESRSISENTKWGIRKRFENGIVRWCKIYGYTKGEAGAYLIVPEEARVVQKIFELYEHGYTIGEIVRILKEQKIPSKTGKAVWTPSSVQRILKNEKYAGDILLQKYLTIDHISHKTVRNECTEVPAYYIENHHEPVVVRQTYDRVQKILELRSQGSCAGRKNAGCIQYPLGSILKCPYCGSPLYQRAVRMQTVRGRCWCCEMGEGACRRFAIRSETLENALLKAYDELDTAKAAEKIKNGETAKIRAAARLTLARKTAHPNYEKVHYYWIDDLIDRVEIGRHTIFPADRSEIAAKEDIHRDDRTVSVYWKCGLKSTVPTGIDSKEEMPQNIAELYRCYLECHREEKKRAEGHIRAALDRTDAGKNRKRANKIAVNEQTSEHGNVQVNE